MAATSNVHEFVLGVSRDADQAIEDHKNLVRGAGLYSLQSLVLGTRVDTGRARGNWQVSEGAPPEGHDPDARDPSGGATVARGSAEIQQADADGIIWLHNGVPYIEFLEELDHMLAGTFGAVQAWWDSQR